MSFRVVALLLALSLAPIARPASPAHAVAGFAETARVIAVHGSGAVTVRNSVGQVYGLVYLGMDGSHEQHDAFGGFHGYAASSHRQRAFGKQVWVQPTRIMGQTQEGMLVLVGHVFLPGAQVPLATDLLGSGLGWYRAEPSNVFDGLYEELEAAARAERNGIWGWPTAVPNLGSTAAPPTLAGFTARPVPAALAPAWDALLTSAQGIRVAEVVEQSGVRIQTGFLEQSWGAYSPQSNLIILDLALTSEDPRAAATVLAHEITHVFQAGTLDAETCVQQEAEAFQVQSVVWSELTGPRPPNRTELEQQLNYVRAIFEQRGVAGLAALVAAQRAYQEECGIAA